MRQISCIWIGLVATVLFTASYPLCAKEPVRFTDYVVEADRIGPVSIGMTLKQMEQSTNRDFELTFFDEDVEDPDPVTSPCYYAGAKGDDARIGFMMAHDKVARIDIIDARIGTSQGVSVGSRYDEVLSRYKEMKHRIETHFYAGSDGHYFIVEALPGQTGILFEIVDNVVVGIRAGLSEPLEYVEGCL